MKTDYTDITFVLDRSGSMSSIWSDVEGALNSFVDNQRKIAGEVKFSLVVFDEDCNNLCVDTVMDAVDIHSFNKIDLKNYPPRGMTPLHDAMGLTINKLGSRLSHMKESDRPAKILFASMTDGHENASKEFKGKVANMVKHQTDQYDWEFIYLGANQDAETVAKGLNIAVGNAQCFQATSRGILQMSNSVNSGAASYRSAEYTKGSFFTKK